MYVDNGIADELARISPVGLHYIDSKQTSYSSNKAKSASIYRYRGIQMPYLSSAKEICNSIKWF